MQAALPSSLWSSRPCIRGLSVTPGTCRRFARTHSILSRTSWTLNDLQRASESAGPWVFQSTSSDPYVNLSIEHYLLTHAHPESHILLLYTNRPCVVIGRNQNPWVEVDLQRVRHGLPVQDRSGDALVLDQARGRRGNGSPGASIDLVRRRSGGGTVFHDGGNLNYSVMVPNPSTKSFRRATHAEMVVRALSPFAPRYGFAEIRVNERNDIVMRRPQSPTPLWLKISGSAFKLTRNRALHHGTLLHSSPYLHEISGLLRSPGRDFIRAKGVESVRSPVGNLVVSPDRARPHEEVARECAQAIASEFWKLYSTAPPAARHPDMIEITVEDEGTCAQVQDSAIATDVAELISDAWRYTQTPGFDFASGTLQGVELRLQVKHGVLEKVAVADSDHVLIERHGNTLGDDIKIHTVTDWRRLLTGQLGLVLPDAVLDRLETVFPRANAQPSSKDGQYGQ